MSNTSARSRPFSFALYIAASALRKSVSGVSCCPSDIAIPIEAVTNTSPSTSGTGFAITSRDPFRDELGGLRARHVLAQHRELVATETRDDVVGAHRAAETVGDRDEQPVSRRVAEAVVHHLEAVEVEEQDRHPACAWRRHA